jgi:lysophospholipase L1-like esterase
MPAARASGLPAEAARIERPDWCPSLPRRVVTAGQRAHFADLAEKARNRQRLKIVAIGSSSTAGSDLADPRAAYPTHVENELNTIFGRDRVRVLNKGRGGETLPETVARFQGDVANEQPDLVIWQLGVNDVVRNTDPAISEPVVDAGLRALSQLGTPIVLMDMQVAPLVTRSPVLKPMQAMLARVAARHNAMVWSRYELMETILASRKATLEQLVRADELHMTVPMHVCTGKVLAESLVSYMGSMVVESPRGDTP